MEHDRPGGLDEEPVEQPGVSTVEPTGHLGVDRVLASLEGMEDREVHEHVSLFEQAHGALRRALDDPGLDSDSDCDPGESDTPRD